MEGREKRGREVRTCTVQTFGNSGCGTRQEQGKGYKKKLQGVEGREVSCSVGVFFKHSTGYTQTKKRTFREVTEKMSTSIK